MLILKIDNTFTLEDRFPTLKFLSIIALAEGISYIAIGITMPLKYGLEIFWPNKIIGWAHGLLFMVFWGSMILGAFKYKWGIKTTAIILFSSLIPFMPFWVEKKYLRA